MNRFFSNINANNSDKNFLIVGALILISILISFLFLFSDGSVFTTVAIILGALIVTMTLYRLEWGLMLFLGLVLLFDQIAPRGYDRSIIGVEYFQNLKSFKFFSNIDFAVVNLLELHLFFVFIVWLLRIILKKDEKLQHVPLWFGALIFFAWLIFSAIYGLSRGGDFLPALWELRALFYLGILYFFVPQIIKTRTQLEQLVWVIIASLSFKVFQGIIRFFRLGFNFDGRTQLTSSEDPLFFISLFVMFGGFFLFNAMHRQRSYLGWLMLPLSIVFILAQRRATYGALAVVFVAFFILISSNNRQKLLKSLTPLLCIIILYLIIFWKSESGFALPAQLIRSSFSIDRENSGERYYSNLYREFENYNLAQTVKTSPLLGIGFGKKYEQPIQLASIPFPLRDYIPHNEIYWIIVKSGGIGFFLFFAFFNSYIFKAGYLFMRLNDPYLKTICSVVIMAIIGQLVVSYYDLQLTYSRNMVYLGTLMGLLPVVQRLDQSYLTGQSVKSNFETKNEKSY